MYTLVNKYGNREVKTESAIKRDHLLKEGFRLVEEQEKEEISQAPGGDTNALEPKMVPVEGVADPSKAPADDSGEDGKANTNPETESATPPVSESDTTALEPKTVLVEGVAAPSKTPAAPSKTPAASSKTPAAKRKNTGNAKNSKTKKE